MLGVLGVLEMLEVFKETGDCPIVFSRCWSVFANVFYLVVASLLDKVRSLHGFYLVMMDSLSSFS